MTRSNLAGILQHLSDRDLAILRDVERFRLLSASQLQRLHFLTSGQGSSASVVRACNRTLARLRRLDLLRVLERRIGGVRSGSAGFVYYLGPIGDRLLRHLEGQPGHRRRYSEPSRHFVDHTLAVAELAVQTMEVSRSGAFNVEQLITEPANWRFALSPQGVTQWLKPDLTLVTADGEYEDHWFIEADLGTEHVPVILRQCAAYQAHWASGRYQAERGVFPTVLWVTTDRQRARAIRLAIDKQPALTSAIFRICPRDAYPSALTEQDEPNPFRDRPDDQVPAEAALQQPPGRCDRRGPHFGVDSLGQESVNGEVTN